MTVRASALWARLRPSGIACLLLSSCSLLTTAQAPAAGRPKDPVVRDSPQVEAQQQRDSTGQASQNGQRIQSPASVALSPKGDLVAWTLRGRAGSVVYLKDLAAKSTAEREIQPNGATDCTSSDLAWSPDGATLAFLSNCATPEGTQGKSQQQIFLWSQGNAAPRQLTHLTGQLQQIAWSPDGKAIGFLFVENATRSAGALDAMKPYSGVIGEDGVEVQRIYAADIDHGNGVFLTPKALHTYEFNWAPQGHDIAFIAAPPPGENNWWVAKLYKEQVDSLYEQMSSAKQTDMFAHDPQLVLDPTTTPGPLHGLQIAVPRFSPDGKHIAFIGGLMSDQGSTGGDVYVINAEGGPPTDVTPGIDGTPSYEQWVNDHTINFVEDRSGHTLLVDWNVEKKAAEPGKTHDLGEVSIGGGPIKDAISYAPAHNGLLAFSEQGFTKAPEVWIDGKAGLEQITHLNAGATPVARTESVEWTNGPFHVQGWLTFPVNYDASQHYPIIVNVHGGPSASIGARWGSGMWASRGYFEFQPNPRGSFGQGEAFTQANRKDFGYGDLHDIEAGLDFIESKYPIDHNREGITGWSYGGFMTMFSVTQTHRFKAAVAGAGLSDWLSYYGENSIDQWMLPFFGASVYDDPAIYARSSAITFIKHVTTPTLVIVGDRDGECPAPQSFEFWHALRDLGVKTQLVVYPDEGHGFRNPEHIRDRDERAARWFAENMPATPATSTGA